MGEKPVIMKCGHLTTTYIQAYSDNPYKLEIVYKPFCPICGESETREEAIEKLEEQIVGGKEKVSREKKIVLKFIADYIAEHSTPPTSLEIHKATGLENHRKLPNILRLLVIEGYITHKPGEKRDITILPAGYEKLEEWKDELY